MRRSVLALAASAPIFLAGCGASAPPAVTPVPLPVIEVPAQVQQACSVLRWALPIAAGMVSSLPPSAISLISAAQPALAACAAGNATEAIVALAAQLQQYLMARGVRPPVGVPILRS